MNWKTIWRETKLNEFNHVGEINKSKHHHANFHFHSLKFNSDNKVEVPSSIIMTNLNVCGLSASEEWVMPNEV